MNKLASAAFVCMTSVASVVRADPVYLDQGWDAPTRAAYYWTTQGSQLIPLDWFLQLEREDSDRPFLEDGLARFGYLPAKELTSPYNLPIGFAVDVRKPTDRQWVGMNCAACHTSEIHHLEKTYRIDGAATDADFYEFIKALGKALSRTASDPARFDRFASNVIADHGDAAAVKALHDELATFSTEFSKFVAYSTPDRPWGPARLDAFGMIFNRVSAIDLCIEANNRTPNAPVSYPFLWGVNYHKQTQWNGSAERYPGNVGYLLRNLGQVMGVFGVIDVTQLTASGYPSSAQLQNLKMFEVMGGSLKAPQWPGEFGAINEAARQRGEAIYRRVGCDQCHVVVSADDQFKDQEVHMTDLKKVKTDPATLAATAVSAAARDTGALAGRPLDAQHPQDKLPKFANPGNLLAHMVSFAAGSADRQVSGRCPPGSSATAPLVNAATPARTMSKTALTRQASGPPSYKARPLNGIWATAPYLHNGSVPNLHELLLPDLVRTRLFSVGSRNFDPVKVGFDSDPRNGNFLFDTSLPGNSNRGHSGRAYGTTLDERERRDLVEYLKTL